MSVTRPIPVEFDVPPAVADRALCQALADSSSSALTDIAIRVNILRLIGANRMA